MIWVTFRKLSSISLEQPLANNSCEPAWHCLLSSQQLAGIDVQSKELVTPQQWSYN